MKQTPTDPVMTPEEFAEAAGVSPETLERLRKYDAVLMDWAERHNLVARSTLPDRWRRHFLDSAQLYRLLPEGTKTIVDLGSGAGFPGLVLAAMGAERGIKVTLVESTKKKAAFLAGAGRAMGLVNHVVLPERIESITIFKPDAITARALASLAKLAGYAHEIAGKNTICLFLKGQDVEDELTEASKSWQMDVIKHPSLTSAGSAILEVRNIAPRGARPGAFKGPRQ